MRHELVKWSIREVLEFGSGLGAVVRDTDFTSGMLQGGIPFFIIVSLREEMVAWSEKKS